MDDGQTERSQFNISHSDRLKLYAQLWMIVADSSVSFVDIYHTTILAKYY